MERNRLKYVILYSIVLALFGCGRPASDVANAKKTILILGGTPSTVDILEAVHDSIKNRYNIISFNRPGFGGSDLVDMSSDELVRLAAESGLKDNDFGIIGISGGAPMAILLADAFNINRCGIISGMVSNEAYFEFADSTFTKEFFQPATGSYEEFRDVVIRFPNLDQIVRLAGTNDHEEALLASYNELHFILTPKLFETITDKSMHIEWWHGEDDRNVAIESVELFLKDYHSSRLNIVRNSDHGIDASIYINKIIDSWKEFE